MDQEKNVIQPKYPVDKIMIIGCGGAGKSTLAKKLHEITGRQLIHLDQVYWRNGWVEMPKEEWIETNRRLLIEKDNWIMDGNYGSTIDMRLEEADMVVFLDLPTHIRLFRVLKRIVKYHGRTRPDMPDGCPERFSWQFIHYVVTYNSTRRRGILEKLKKYENGKKIFRIRKKSEERELLEYLRNY